MELVNHFVEFDEWCPKCRHVKVTEHDAPCDECLAQPVNYASTKPVKWEEDEKRR